MDNKTVSPLQTSAWHTAFNMVAGQLGLILNGWLIVATLRKNLIDGNFKIYVGNLAAADFLFAIVTVAEAILAVLLPSYSGLLCKIQGYLMLTCFSLTTTALLPVTLYRYGGIFYEDLFERFTAKSTPGILLCVVSDLIAFGCSAMVSTQGKLGRSTGPMEGTCFVSGDGDSSFGFAMVSQLVGMSLLHVAIFAANVKIYRSVKNHQTIVKRLKNRRRIREIKQLTRATLAQAITPVLVQIPITVAGFYRAIGKPRGQAMASFRRASLISTRIIPVADAIITIIMVRQYRQVFIGWLQNVKKGSCVMDTGNAVVTIAKTPKNVKLAGK